MRFFLLTLLFSFYSLNATYAANSLGGIKGGDWPFPVYIDPLTSDEASGLWDLWDEGLVIEMTSLVYNKHIWIELKRENDQALVASGLLAFKNGTFEGFIKYFEPKEERVWSKVVIGRGKYRENERSSYSYFIEWTLSGERVRTHLMSKVN